MTFIFKSVQGPESKLKKVTGGKTRHAMRLHTSKIINGRAGKTVSLIYFRSLSLSNVSRGEL